MKALHQPAQQPELLKAETLKDRLQVSLRTIRTWQQSGVIPFIRVGRSVRFNPAKVIDALEAAHGVSPKPPARN